MRAPRAAASGVICMLTTAARQRPYCKLSSYTPKRPDYRNGPMQITLNGELQDVPEDLDMTQLIERLGLAGRRIAVEVNRELLPRSRFGTYRLRDGDQVEIIHAVGGG